MDFEFLQEHLNLLFERMTLFTALLKFSLFVDVGQTYKSRNKKEEHQKISIILPISH
jgi:hypothetical protein